MTTVNSGPGHRVRELANPAYLPVHMRRWDDTISRDLARLNGADIRKTKWPLADYPGFDWEDDHIFSSQFFEECRNDYFQVGTNSVYSLMHFFTF